MQKDPKQQELKTHSRPRLDLGPYWRILLRPHWIKNTKHVKAMVLLCFRSTMFKKQRFSYVFVQQCWTRVGFTMFSPKHVENSSGFVALSLKHVEKAYVLLCSLCKCLLTGFQIENTYQTAFKGKMKSKRLQKGKWRLETEQVEKNMCVVVLFVWHIQIEEQNIGFTITRPRKRSNNGSGVRPLHMY